MATGPNISMEAVFDYRVGLLWHFESGAIGASCEVIARSPLEATTIAVRKSKRGDFGEHQMTVVPEVVSIIKLETTHAR